MLKKPAVAKVFSPEANLKRAIRRHFTALGFEKADDGTLILPGIGKDVIRHLHGDQRSEKLESGKAFLDRVSAKLLPHFADGTEIDPRRIRLTLRRVRSGTRKVGSFSHGDAYLVRACLRRVRASHALPRLGRGA